jgi:crotonobetaine/carnitine-CoA ligase
VRAEGLTFPELSTTVHGAVEHALARNPRASMVRFLGGRDLSAQDMHQSATAVAAALRRAQVERGDRVVVMLDNCEEFLFSFFGCSMAAATMVPLNTGLLGVSLRYQVEDSGASLAIVQDRYLQRLQEASTGVDLRRIVVVGEGQDDMREGVESYDAFVGGTDVDGFSPVSQKRGDRSMILYTSGTTGPPKGIMYSHGATLAFADAGARGYAYLPGDIAFACLPLFHVNALLNVSLGAILHATPVVLSKRFSVSSFWEEVVEARGTTTPMLGSMATLLLQREPSDAERAARLRTACVVPAPLEYHDELEDRFGFHVITFYGLTDAGTLTTTAETKVGSAGKAFPEWELIIADDDDNEVPVGVVGEMLVRPRVPHITPLGYWQKPEVTVEAWQGQWIHTGDYMRVDDEGHFYFVDRKKDAIRSRGENVSSFEVEQVALGHPGVADAAAYAVESDLSEDDVMIAVVPSPRHPLDWAELQAHCSERLPFFAVPRYFRAVGSLPRTQNGKVQKSGLRSDGVTVDTHDLGRTRRDKAAVGKQEAAS